MRYALNSLMIRNEGLFRSAPFRNTLFTLFIVGTLAYGAAFAYYMLSRFALVNMLGSSFDDAFYYFQIAWHMARGEFSTFDGGITRTNGYHPLWLFLITPFYWVFDKVEALYAIKTFEVMLVAGAVALVGCAARLARQPWILLFPALPMLYRHPPLFMGTEAAAGLFMLGGLFLTVCLYAREPAKWWWALAGLAFALPWVRLEYVAISLIATGALCLLEWSWRDPEPGTLSLLRVRASVPFLAAVSGLLVYFAYNAIVFGGIVPVSGAVKSYWSQGYWEREGGYSLTKSVDAFLASWPFDNEVPIALVLCMLLPLVWWCARRTRAREDWLLLTFLVGVFSLAAGHLAKFVQSVLTAHPAVELTGWWYFVPAYLMKTLAIPTLCYVALYLVRRFLGPRPESGSKRAYRDPRVWIVLAGTFFLLVKADFGNPYRFVDSKRNYSLRHQQFSYYMGTMVMNRLLPEGSIVGSWNAGVIGYFSRFPVVHLEGLVNSYDYLHAVKEETATAYHDYLHVAKEGIAASYRMQFGISNMADINPYFYSGGHLLFEDVPLDVPGWKVEKAEEALRFRIWSADHAAESGIDRPSGFWERMEPHLQYQPGGVGLLMDGRMASAFVRDCAPDELAIWTWGSRPEETVSIPWTQTSVGFCTSAIVLPHDASPPVRVATMTARARL